mmetsp:Transcript_26911/g.75110  ORF Transcript_26911/g.75110 Transcript_26911/m.75110 type:complete len:361 (+) Transcript_26911:479-1561(+)
MKSRPMKGPPPPSCRPMTRCPTTLDMPSCVTMAAATCVHCWKSFEAPVVTLSLPFSSSSAIRPPSATHMRFSKNSLEYSPVFRRSSEGMKIVTPPAGPRGTMLIFATMSKSFIKAPRIACPASWYATSFFFFSDMTASFFSKPMEMRSKALEMSSASTSVLFCLAATIAPSLRRFAKSAPDMPGVCRATADKSTLGANVLSLACTFKIAVRPSTSGGSTWIWRSKRPGRTRAWSRISARFVAAITTTPLLPSKPSISVSNWFTVCSRSSLPWPKPALRCRPTASISSMKMMHGADFFAFEKRSRTREAPMPAKTSTNSDAEMLKNGTPASPATALASRVLPVPGGPTSSAPLGILAPRSE